MGPIEWILVIEGIVLVVAGICGSTAYFSRPVNQDPDRFLRAMMGFWRTVGARRLVLDPLGAVRVVDDENDEEAVAAPTPRVSAAAKPTSAASPSAVLRGGVAVPPAAQCAFNVTVIAKSPTNDILGRDAGGLRMGVTGAADGAVANKLVLAIVAREFGVKPYQVQLTRGHFGSAKAVRIAGVSQDYAEQLLRRFPVV